MNKRDLGTPGTRSWLCIDHAQVGVENSGGRCVPPSSPSPTKKIAVRTFCSSTVSISGSLNP
ncbi:MAG: hypothetical protein WD492_05560 [Alkalispirochaeta sp.]